MAALRFTLDNNRHLRHTLSKNKLSEDDLLAAIEVRYAQIRHQPGKVKSVQKARHQGYPVLEFKVPCKGNKILRIAYSVQDDKAVVFFASDDIIKAHFSRKLLQTDLVH